MSDPREARWQEFSALGEEEVRKRLGAHQYGEDKIRLAREWLEYHASIRTSSREEATLAEARRANSLAAAANELAERANSTADAAASSARATANALDSMTALTAEANSIAERAERRVATANTIATLALIASVIAIAIGIIIAFVKK